MDLSHTSADDVLDADFVVVGGGTAGAIVASHLARRGGGSVVLVEAGPDFPTLEETPPVLRFGAYSEGRVTTRDFAWDWETVLTAPGGTPYTLYSGKVVGGGSAVNGQVWLHGLSDDFDDNWARRGAVDWSWAEVARWYAATESDQDFPQHDASGPVPVRRVPMERWHPLHTGFLAACLDAGHAVCPDLNADRATGVGPQPFNNVDGVRISTALSHLREARPLASLRVLAGHHADRLVFEGGRASGVLVGDPAGRRLLIRAEQETVLAAGAIGTAWLLLRSGIGPAAQLRRHGIPVVADLPGVGASLREHPQVGVRWRARPGHEIDPTSARSPVALRLTAPGSRLRDDLKISIAAIEDGRAVQATVFLMLALSDGTLTLSPAGAGARPVIDLAFLRDPEDRRRMRESVRLTIDLVESSRNLSGIVGQRLEPIAEDLADDDALDDWLRRMVQGTFHPSSTCAIGTAESRGAVVGQMGQAHGINDLRIVDASIMPDSVRANLNATVAMMAQRIAAVITSPQLSR